MHFGVFPVSLRKICVSMTSTAYTSSLFLLAVFRFRWNLFRFSVIFCSVLRFLIYSNIPSLMQPGKVSHKVQTNKNAINFTFICCLTYNLSRPLIFTPAGFYFPFIFTVKMFLHRRYFYDLLDSTRKVWEAFLTIKGVKHMSQRY